MTGPSPFTSSQPSLDAVCEILSKTFEQGITIIGAQGYYSGADCKVVWVVLNRFQISKMRDLVHDVDPKAYITIYDVADVFKLDAAAS